MKLFNCTDKTFRGDLLSIQDLIERNIKFSFSKFADGELAIMVGKNIENKEFRFNNIEDNTFREELLKAFQFKNNQYFVGISCPCCQSDKIHKQMKNMCQQDDNHLTWANIFVNYNHNYFTNTIVPLLSNKDIILICNESMNTKNLPFNPLNKFNVSNNAWHNNKELIPKLITEYNDSQNLIFLVSAGPFGNILVHNLTINNANNTYIDVGSSLNRFYNHYNREYLKHFNNQNYLPCVWGN